MTYFAIVLLVLMLGLSVWTNIRFLMKNLSLSEQRDTLVDTIEESLDVLDSCYTDIAHASEIPVLSDEPVIRDVLSAIKRAKNAVLAIASNVVIYGNDPDEEGKD